MVAHLQAPDSGIDRAPLAPPPSAWRLLALVVVAALFPLAAFYAPPLLVLRSGPEHALLDLLIALSACFCSLQSLVRYQSRPQPMFLWLAAGFLVSGLLDGLHAMVSLEYAVSSGAEDHVGTWSWTASSVLLGAYLVLGLGLDRPPESPRNASIHASIIGGTTAGALLILLPALLFAPLRPAVWVDLPVHRPYEFAAAAAMLLAVMASWRRHALLDPPFRRMLGVALVIYFSLHAGVMAWSAHPLDTFVGVSHLAKFLAHFLVLLGLLQSSANLLTEAEGTGAQIAAQAEEIEARERQIRTIVNHAPYAILTADEQGHVRDINPVAEQLFAVPRDQAVGRPLHTFFDEGLREELDATVGPGEQSTRARLLLQRQSRGDETGRSRRALSREARGVREDGEQFPVALTLTDSVAGGHRFFTAFVRDLTRTLEQEQKIQQSLTLTTRILDHTSVAIYSTDAAGVITRFNRTAQQWLGYTEQETCGHLTPAAFHDREELQRHAAALTRERGVPVTTDVEIVLGLARRGEPEEREWTLVRRNGSRFPASVSVVPLATEAGHVHGFVLVANDLSHQKEVEQLKNEFVSTVSHELRTPLTSVRGSLGLLSGGLAGKLPAQAQSLLDIAQRNTERLILLINDILDIEKIEAGKMRFSLRSLDLDTLVGEAVQTAEGLAATRSVKLVRRAKSPGLRVQADEQRLLQVMANLLSNAIKFSPEAGSIEVDVATQDGRARVAVTDHGGGIPQASQERIFQKFFQADSSSTREKGGTGLGLSICKALLERMDGRIGFRSKPGETVFHFELPADRAAAAGAAARRVLIVEDDDDAAAVLGQILQRSGLESDVAHNAVQAKDMLQKRHYDCMTLDVMLPDQNGMALLAELRRQDYGRHLPIIVVSIYDADQPALAAASAARVSDWLTKPIDSQRLLASVRQALRINPDVGVLVVEDDVAMGALLRKLLAEVAPVTLARTLAEGREMIERHPYSLVILDIGLPDGSGYDLLPVLQIAQPRTPIVIFSAREISDELAAQVAKVLSKNRTSDDDLVKTVKQLLNGSEPVGGAAAGTHSAG